METEEQDKQILWTNQEKGQRAQIHGEGMKEKKKQKQGRIEPERAGSCEEVQFVLVKLAAHMAGI